MISNKKDALVKLMISLFLLIPVKLMYYYCYYSGPPKVIFNVERRTIIDNESNILATSMDTFSLYCSPYELIDSYETIAKDIAKILNVPEEKIFNRLLVQSKFVWISRHIKPEHANKIASLGYSGIYITKDTVRFYPFGDLFYHIIGKVDDENHGVLAIEKQYDDYLSNEKNAPLQLSLNIRYQHILQSEMKKARKEFKAKSAGGAIVCAKTGKILALSSVSKLKVNPHFRSLRNEFNPVLQGKFEIGSIMKVMSAAMFLEKELVTLDTELKIPPLYYIGKHAIKDYGRKHTDILELTFKEAFVVSSNVAFLMLANDNLSLLEQKEFYSKLGIFDSFSIGNLEINGVTFSPKMRTCDISVFSYGYGISISMASYLRGFLRVVTGKNLSLHIEENYKQDPEEQKEVLSKEIVENTRKLLALSGARMTQMVKKIKVGGKTGTSTKIINGVYDKTKNFTTYVFAYPIDNPKIIGIIYIDEPNKNGVPLYAYESALIASYRVILKLLNELKELKS